MGKKFTSFKRYGLEGAESALVALEEMLVQANRTGYEKVVIGMPHRGRLNMLVSLLDLPARALFAKVKGQSLVPEGMDAWDDVASHLAITTSKKFDRSASNPLTVSLLHNPSHLEAVNPVALGKTKAKQDDYPQKDGVEKVLSLQLHGDSAYAGQGIVPESLQMAYLTEFSVGYENKRNKTKTKQKTIAHRSAGTKMQAAFSLPLCLQGLQRRAHMFPLFGMCFLCCLV
jgi:probable 2-oxoglutarate dehydrogenase E1 component DHKTD1